MYFGMDCPFNLQCISEVCLKQISQASYLSAYGDRSERDLIKRSAGVFFSPPLSGRAPLYSTLTLTQFPDVPAAYSSHVKTPSNGLALSGLPRPASMLLRCLPANMPVSSCMRLLITRRVGGKWEMERSRQGESERTGIWQWNKKER